MTEARRLSDFQERTEAALVSALAAVGSALAVRRLEGAKEIFIRAQVGGTDAEVFIYQDEAELLAANLDRRFEVPDYRDGGALASDFIDQTVDYAKRYARKRSVTPMKP